MIKKASQKKAGKSSDSKRPARHKSFLLTKGKVKKTHKSNKKLPGAFSVLLDSVKRLRHEWKVFAGLLVMHLVLQLVFSSSGVAGSTMSEAQLLYSLFFLVIISLSYVWVLRSQAQDDENIRISLALYRGPFQIVPFLLLVLLAVVQAIPFSFGAVLFQIVVQGNIAIYYWERLLFAGIWLGLSIPTAYWLTTTLMSLVVVAIPGVRPVEAWKATKKLVRPYTAQILWRLTIFFVVLAFIVGGIFYALFSLEQITLALLIPTVLNVVLVPLFWAYVFSLYSHLRKL